MGKFKSFRKYCSVHTKKVAISLIKEKYLKIFGFFGGQDRFFLGLAVLVIMVIIVKSACPWLLSLLSLLAQHFQRRMTPNLVRHHTSQFSWFKIEIKLVHLITTLTQ